MLHVYNVQGLHLEDYYNIWGGYINIETGGYLPLVYCADPSKFATSVE